MRKILLFCGLMLTAGLLKAQMYDAFVHQGEFGIGVGVGHYFGDLNNEAKINRPKFAAGIFYNKQFNNYISLRIAGDYAFLGYSDSYSSNPVQQRRNLSFNTNVWEVSASGFFNFFKFIPGFVEYSFTPYVGLGIGVFTFDPYTYLRGEKVYLRPLGTEGQGSPLYPNLKPYSTIAMSIPLTVGVKKALNERMNVFAEISYRFTSTDYLDDVSGNYAPDAFSPVDANGNPSTWYLLQDRSYETGPPIGVKGRQRGTSSQKDAFVTLHVGVSFNLQSYRCPTH
ncbi:MAG: outer membrane beta-barrel protein [Sphingobacteriia bacterium]|nr:outer membrane beta-barrel protein [Sphingobacteriia bacterium]